MFKKYIERIAAAETIEEMERVFLEADRAYQQEKITWKEHQLIRKLLDTIGRIAE